MIEKSINFSQHTYDFKGEEMEILRLSLKDDVNFPIIVLIHGFGTWGAWEMLAHAYRLAKSGYTILLPSQIGFGYSGGKRDYCGPNTVDSVAYGIKELVRENNLNNKQIAVWGVSRGAIVASMLLVRYSELFKAGVLQSGGYDFEKSVKQLQKPSEILTNIINETGGTKEEYERRSPILQLQNIACPVIILHGRDDEILSVTQAIEMDERLTALCKEHSLVIFEGKGHHIGGYELRNDYVLPFLEKNLKKKK